MPGVAVLVFEPAGAPAAAAMTVNTKRPRMTPGRAALIELLRRYAEPGFGVTKLELQKLVYLLQAAGEPLGYDFVRAKYGPYAEQLNHALQNLEGHFIRGYGDRSESSSIQLMPGAADEAASYLAAHKHAAARYELIATLIDGFESPYGLELLTTTLWTMHNEPQLRDDLPSVVGRVRAWSGRKKRLFTPEHIAIAWERLHDEGWLASLATVHRSGSGASR